jgi:hypothetical protein
MASEFKIGRLRYTWKGVWTTATFYNRDAVASYNGKTYVCIVPHTSTDFYANYQNIEPSGEVKPYWVIMLEGTSWKGDWLPNTLYTLGAIVLYGGAVFKCIVNHTSTSTITLANWESYVIVNSTWIGNYSLNHFYKLGDTVKYGGIVYRCTTEHTSSNVVTYPTYVNWEIVDSGIEYRNTWSSTSVAYKINDIVKYGPDLWISRQDHISALPFDATIDPLNVTAIWQLWMPGIDYSAATTWDATIIYQPGDTVKYGGYSFINLKVNNINTVPSTHTQGLTPEWQLLTTGYDFNDEWSTVVSYKIGSVVRRSGNLFEALQDNAAQDPTGLIVTTTYTAAGSSGITLIVNDTTDIYPGMIISGVGFTKGQFVTSVTDSVTLTISQPPYSTIVDNQQVSFAGINGDYWVPLVPGTRWRNRWVANTSYVVGDLAVWVNATYRCIRTHTSDVAKRPDNDVRTYWVVELNHDYYNVLNIKGDIIVSVAGQNRALPIGQEGYLLKSVLGVPTWSNVFQSPALYYVAPSGTDAVTSGYTWDNPFKTIKYACERIAAGTLNSTAKALLKQNKDFIVEEAYGWQVAQAFPQSLDATRTRRDSRYLMDAIIYDLSRGGNSQTIAFTVAFFDKEYGSKFITPAVAIEIVYFISTINQIFSLVTTILNNTVVGTPYQTVFSQNFGEVTDLATVITSVQSYQSIIVTALNNKNISSIPPENQGLTATLMIKTGDYHEELPIVVPANTALNGDELRSVIVYPKNIINTIATRSVAGSNLFTVVTTEGMGPNTPIQFVSINPVSGFSSVFSGLTAGQTYYVIGTSITSTQFSVSTTPNGAPVTLSNITGQMKIFGGDALKDMFRVQNGTGIRNMTLSGLLGTLTVPNTYTTRRPTGGSFVSLDPGLGANDTSAWIYRKSPYIQNVTTFGTGCTGLKIDGSLHSGGNKSIVCNDFTQIVSDGIGIWCTGPGALTEAVSVFSYYAYSGYFSEAGGRIRATNGNSSYGNYGVIAEGYDTTEVPVTGTVYNRYYEATATPLSALGATANILKLQYSHAGQDYLTPTTNLLKYSNSFTNWTSDGNITLVQSILNPYINQSDAWLATGNTSGTDSSYFAQSVTIAPSGASYTALSGTNITGGGLGATFDIIVTSTQYIVTINDGGSGYVATNQIRVLGAQLGGITGVNDLVITVTELSGTTITNISSDGTVQVGSIQPYTASIFCKQGTANIFDLFATFSGYSTATSKISYNFSTNTITAGNATGGMIPSVFSITPVSSNPGWVRLSFRFYDVSGLNTSLQIKIYPRSQLGNSGYTLLYGAQLELGTRLGFYQRTTTGRYTGYANYDVVGAGSGVDLVADEIRYNSVYQTRLVEVNGVTGGVGYKLSTNNAQAGTASSITIAGSDVAGSKDYLGMRVFVNSGIGAGQYGIISIYDATLKIAKILKESFTQLEITSSSSTGNIFTLSATADVYSLYTNQPVQFVTTNYDTSVTLVGQTAVTVLTTLGGQTNTMYVTSTAQLTIDMAVTFSGTTFGGVTSGFTYYITSIIDDNNIQVALTIGGVAIFLNNAAGTMSLNYPSNTSYLNGSTTNMDINLPIYFTGLVLSDIVASTDYYINEVIDANNFTISDSLVTPTVSATTAISNSITVDTSDTLVPLNPIKFTGTAFGGIVVNSKYYINHIIDSTHITLSPSVLTTAASATQDQGDLITVGDTTGFVIGNPITFTGTTFGGIVNDRVYYISYINNATSLTISATSSALSVTATATSASISLSGTTYTNVITVGSSSNIAPMYSITFSGTTFGGITAGPVYYVSKIYDATHIGVTTSVISTIATNTAPTSNLITVSSTTGFVANNPVIFGGATFGNIQSGTVYYISAINDATSFTISTVPGGSALILQLGSGSVTVRTPIANVPLSAASGTMTGTTRANTSTVPLSAGVGNCIVRTTSPMLSVSTATGVLTGTSTTVKNILVSDSGTMTGTFNVPLLGGITQGDTYYVRTINVGASNTFTVTSVIDGTSNVTLTDSIGSMQIGQVGWDHVNPGTPLVASFDSTSVYSIEPRIKYSAPPFISVSTPIISQAPGTSYISAGNGNGKVVGLANNDATLAVSVNGFIWTQQALPYSASWTGITYGSSYWVIISSGGSTGGGSKVLYSNSDLATWKTSYLPSYSTWRYVTYGNGTFVAITNNSASSAYSTNFGATWTSSTGLPNTTWSGLTYGGGIFVAVATGGTQAARSSDGITWTSSTLPSSTTWSGIAYGNGRFVASSSTLSKTAYSFDGITWYQSLYTVIGTNIAYGNGVFVLVGDETLGPVNYISEDGIVWNRKTGSPSMGPIVFGNNLLLGGQIGGRFLSIKGQNFATIVDAGSQPKSRATVVAGKITEINEWDPGSNYTTVPTVTIVDTNATILASVTPLKGSGVLGNPTFINRGAGYNTNTTTIIINGDGYAEKYQTGLGIIISGLSVLPVAGDNLAITGNDTIYKVTSATLLDGTVTPNILAKVFVSPEVTVGLSPAHLASVSIRTKYSQVRLTNHDYLNIGYGNFQESNYPLLPTTTELSQQNEAVDANYGRVFYSSTDQDGNFRVGKLFAVEQATGIITLSASQFGLSGLNELKIGGVAVGGNSVIITQFSTDSTFVANSNSIVPTQKAIKAYLGAKLTQGGSNTFTGQLIAGTVLIGGPDKISSTIVEGNDGWHVRMPRVVNVKGINDGNGGGAGGWDGDGMAMMYFQKSFAAGNIEQ